MSYIVDREFLLSLQQEDTLVDGPHRTHGAWVSLETKCGLLCWKILDGGELQNHLQSRQRGAVALLLEQIR